MQTFIVTMPDAYWGSFAHPHGYFSRSTPAIDSHDAVAQLREPIRQAIATIPGAPLPRYTVIVYPAMLPADRHSFAVNRHGMPIGDAPRVREYTVR